jgi:hypothetical protein
MTKDPYLQMSKILWPNQYGDLVNSETAPGIAVMVFQDKFGRNELIKRLPLKVVDADDCWEICAPYKPSSQDPQPDGTMLGSFYISIKKSDGQICGIIRERQLPISDLEKDSY